MRAGVACRACSSVSVSALCPLCWAAQPARQLQGELVEDRHGGGAGLGRPAFTLGVDQYALVGFEPQRESTVLVSARVERP